MKKKKKKMNPKPMNAVDKFVVFYKSKVNSS